MIRKAALDDSSRIAEINVTSSRYAYKSIVSEKFLYEDFYEKNHYCFDGEEKIFKRWNKQENRYVNG